MKTVGIIGGLGPETTSEFYLEVIFNSYKKNKKSRPPILIWNVPLEYKIEEDLIKNAKGEERYIPYLIEAAKRLESGGADFIVMPCNSLHIFIKEIRNAVKIPVLNILEETAKFLRKKNIKKVGVLATKSALKRKLYEKALTQEGINQVTLEENDQDKVGKLINNIVLNRHDDKDKKELLSLISKFEKNDLKNVILACTDLQILEPEHPRLKIYDSMRILVEATVNKIF